MFNVMKKTQDQQCTCGHPREMHEHYRGGSDCGHCGFDGCAQFRRAWKCRSVSEPATTPIPVVQMAQPVDLGEFAKRRNSRTGEHMSTRQAG